MLTVSRRGLLASAAFTATAFTATFGHKGLVFPSSAHAETSLEPTTGFYKYKVGSIEVTAVYDGIWRKPHDPTFIKNASVEETKDALAKAGLTTEFMPIPLTVIVLKIGDRHIMVDAGSGVGQWQANATHLPANMNAAGYRPQPDQHHPGLAFSSRSRLGADGERHQRAPSFPMPNSSSTAPNTNGGRSPVGSRSWPKVAGPPASASPTYSRRGRTGSSSRTTRKSHPASGSSPRPATRPVTRPSWSPPARIN